MSNSNPAEGSNSNRNDGVLIPLDVFAHDLEVNLGRANGNVYHRRPGVEGVHDGQVLVRLKKKRFIILDYSLEPTEHDLQVAQQTPNVKIFEGAGKRKCTMSNCSKIGVPVCLWDSEPNEVDSLYLRSGMCFTCQRNLNEKRRTERKRATARGDLGGSASAASPSLIYALGPHPKKFKLSDGNLLHIDNDAIIMTAPSQLLDGLPALRQAGPCSLQEQSQALQTMTRRAAADIDQLLLAVSGHVQDAAAAAVQAVGGAVAGEDDEEVGSAALSAEAAANAVVGLEEAERREGIDTAVAGASPPIHDLYEKAFKSLNKAIYLLHQWKESWDGAVESVADPNFADAVASAAAVVAAAADGSEQGNSMVSLLLAADQRKESHKGDHAREDSATGADCISI